MSQDRETAPVTRPGDPSCHETGRAGSGRVGAGPRTPPPRNPPGPHPQAPHPEPPGTLRGRRVRFFVQDVSGEAPTTHPRIQFDISLDIVIFETAAARPAPTRPTLPEPGPRRLGPNARVIISEGGSL